MKIIITTIAALALSSAFSFGNLTFYKTDKGGYSKVNPKDLRGGESFKITESKTGDITQVKRNFFGCGGWSLSLTYKYDDNGNLTKIESNFYTANGVVDRNSDFIPTTCIEIFEVADREIKLVSKKVLDAKTQKVVKRGLPERSLIGHWATTREVPVISK